MQYGEKDRFAARLRAALEAAGMEIYGSASTVAAWCGKSAQAGAMWLNGDTMPAIENGAVIARRLGVDLNWLYTGERFADADVREDAGDYVGNRERVLLDLFDTLPPEEQDELIRALEEKKQRYLRIADHIGARRKTASDSEDGQ